MKKYGSELSRTFLMLAVRMTLPNLLILLVFISSASAESIAQTLQMETSPQDVNLAPVIFHGRKIFQLGAVSTLSAEQRAEDLAKRLERIAKSPLKNPHSLLVREDNDLGVSTILLGEEFVNAVWEEEAVILNNSRSDIAQERCRIMGDAIEAYRYDFSPLSITRGILFTVLATVVLLLLLKCVSEIRKREELFIEQRLSGKKLGKVSIGGEIIAVNRFTIRLLRIVVLLWLFIVYLNLVLSFFPRTFHIAARLYDLITTPIKTFGQAFVVQIPNLFTLITIVVITVVVLRVIKPVFAHVSQGTIEIKGFYSDWSDTTYQLVRLVVIGFAAVAAFPYIPGSSSPAFKAISIFMGVLFSLGSTSAVANVISGLILTYMRPFVVGDNVQVSQTLGTVLERRLLSTRIRTPKNEMVAIPNSTILNSHIVNYSSMTHENGLLLHTTVTIGYDVPWRTVHGLLIRAAQKTSDILSEPEPFVLQTSLNDFYIGYEINAATIHAGQRPRIYSELHQNIQDVFAEAGVEIMSPHYRHVREGNNSTIPPVGSEVES